MEEVLVDDSTEHDSTALTEIAVSPAFSPFPHPIMTPSCVLLTRQGWQFKRFLLNMASSPPPGPGIARVVSDIGRNANFGSPEEEVDRIIRNKQNFYIVLKVRREFCVLDAYFAMETIASRFQGQRQRS